MPSKKLLNFYRHATTQAIKKDALTFCVFNTYYSLLINNKLNLQCDSTVDL